MKEQSPLRRTLETAGKIWTYVSIPLELILVGHGLAYGKSGEIILGAVGLIGDYFALKWFNRNKMNEAKMTSPRNYVQAKGIERFFPNVFKSKRLVQATS